MDPMDENKQISIEFLGRTVLAAPLEESQIAVLATMRYVDDVPRNAHTVFRIIERAVGPEEWARFDADMISGHKISVFTEFAVALAEETEKAAERERQKKDLSRDDDLDTELKKAEALLAAHRKSDA